MAIRKIKASWWVDFRVDHTRYRKRSPENTKAGAAAYEAFLRQKLARGELVERRARATPAVPLFKDFAWTWFNDYVLANSKPSGRRGKRSMLQTSLVPFFGESRIDEISARHIEQYKAELARRGRASRTINNYLASLHKCLKAGYSWLDIEGSPPAIIWLKCPPPKTEFLSHEECDALLAHAQGTTREMILLALRTGMRQGEIKGLQWSSINWQTMTIIVRHSKDDTETELGSTKSNRERHVPMHRDVYDALVARRRDSGYVFLNRCRRPFNHPRISKRLADVCKRAGVRRVGWHAFRHTFASHLAMDGVPLGAIQALLGHSSITTTMRYAHLAPSTLRSAIDLLGTRRAPDGGQPVGNRWLEHRQSA